MLRWLIRSLLHRCLGARPGALKYGCMIAYMRVACKSYNSIHKSYIACRSFHNTSGRVGGAVFLCGGDGGGVDLHHGGPGREAGRKYWHMDLNMLLK